VLRVVYVEAEVLVPLGLERLGFLLLPAARQHAVAVALAVGVSRSGDGLGLLDLDREVPVSGQVELRC
jgi:hypothetical protein